MKKYGCYFAKPDEIKKLSDYCIDSEKGAVNPVIVGKPATWIAEQAGVKFLRVRKFFLQNLTA